MFSTQPPKPPYSGTVPESAAQPSASILGPDLEIDGHVQTTGTAEIHAQITGNVRAASVAIANSARVTGDVSAEEITVRGKIEGRITGVRITVAQSGTVSGAITYERLSVEPGSIIDGELISHRRGRPG